MTNKQNLENELNIINEKIKKLSKELENAIEIRITIEKELNSIKKPVIPNIDDNTRKKLSKIYIENIFVGGSYNRFIQYCLVDRRANGLEIIDTLDKLIDFDFDSLKKVKGIGESKINKIIEKFNETINNINTLNKDNSVCVGLFNFINCDLLDEDIDYLKIFNIRHKIINTLKSNGIYKIKDLSGIQNTVLKRMLGYQNVIYLTNLDKYLSSDPINNLLYVFDTTKNTKEFNICSLRVNKTLQEIGNIYNVSRERIRQLQDSYLEIITIALNPIIKKLLSNSNHFDEMDLYNLIKNNSYTAISVLGLKEKSNLDYLSYANIFLQKTNENIPDKIEKIIFNNLKDEICITTDMRFIIKELWLNGYDYIMVKHIINFLLNIGYTKFGDYMFKTKPSYAILCSKIISERFPKGMHKNSENIKILREEFKKEFGFELDSDDRAISTRLDDYLVICGRGKVTTSDHVHIDEDLLIEIKNYIDSLIHTKIMYADVYEVFKNKLTQLSNVNNYYFLHGVLKLYYPNEYNYIHRDYFLKN